MARGGKRDGAGRKPVAPEEKKIPTGFRLARDVVAFLATTKDGTAFVENTVRRSTAYREWKRRRSG